MRPKSTPPGMMRLTEVARVIGVDPRTLLRKIADGTVPEPARNEKNGHRLWSAAEANQLRAAHEMGLDDRRRARRQT